MRAFDSIEVGRTALRLVASRLTTSLSAVVRILRPTGSLAFPQTWWLLRTPWLLRHEGEAKRARQPQCCRDAEGDQVPRASEQVRQYPTEGTGARDQLMPGNYPGIHRK